MRREKSSSPPILAAFAPWFCGLFGFFLGVGLIKFGNPIILNSLIDLSPDQFNRLHPSLYNNPVLLSSVTENLGLYDLIIQPWPITKGLWFLGLLIVFALPFTRWHRPEPKFVFISLAIWLSWQLISSIYSVKSELSELTLIHFIACVSCGFIGWGILSQYKQSFGFWIGLSLGYFIVLWHGFGQHYGGLEAVRSQIYENVDWKNLPPDVLRRFTSNRIFSTLVYPNALAGIILILFPPLLINTWKMTARLGNIGRGIITGLLAYSSLACLVWSGSKAGWLIGMAILVLVMFKLGMPKKLKWTLVALTLGLGLLGFGLRYSGYFARGATSAGARLDYWRAGLQIALNNPWLGTGPGTFGVPYSQIKAPKAEMTRLVHNDYLEQASDSGWLGFLAYSWMILGSILFLYRHRITSFGHLEFSIFLGFLAWALQGLLEFGLYIPASAWIAFTFLGWLIGCHPKIQD